MLECLPLHEPNSFFEFLFQVGAVRVPNNGPVIRGRHDGVYNVREVRHTKLAAEMAHTLMLGFPNGEAR